MNELEQLARLLEEAYEALKQATDIINAQNARIAELEDNYTNLRLSTNHYIGTLERVLQ